MTTPELHPLQAAYLLRKIHDKVVESETEEVRMMAGSERVNPKRVNPFTQVPQTEPDVPIIYVSGPVSAYTNLNRPAFVDAQRRLRGAGYFAIIPHAVVDPDAPWLQAMAACVNAMARADGVALLDGWEDSDGAKIEVVLADRGGLPIATVDEWCEGVEA